MNFELKLLINCYEVVDACLWDQAVNETPTNELGHGLANEWVVEIVVKASKLK